MKIKVYKFIDGSEVIAKELSESVNAFTLAKLRVIQVMPHESGRMGVGLMPWLIAAPDSDVTISKTQVMADIEVSSEIEGLYLQQTSSLDLTSRM